MNEVSKWIQVLAPPLFSLIESLIKGDTEEIDRSVVAFQRHVYDELARRRFSPPSP